MHVFTRGGMRRPHADRVLGEGGEVPHQLAGLGVVGPHETADTVLATVGADQDLSIEVHEKLVKDVPSERKAAKAEALLQLAWSRINKVAWNRNLDDKDVRAAYQDADQAGTFAEIPLDKFIAEYTMEYSLLFTPNRDNGAILQRLTEAKQWFGEVPGNNQQIWDFFIVADSLKSVLDADPMFKPLLASGAPNKG